MTTPTLPENLPALQSGDPEARAALVLHGGGGPQTVAPIVGHLAATMHAVAPTHPGWDGTARPDQIASIADLASAYLGRLIDRDERDVVVIGSSIGGWIALEMAVQAAADERYAGVIGAVIDIDGVGAVVNGEPIADFFALDARGWPKPRGTTRSGATWTRPVSPTSSAPSSSPTAGPWPP